METATIPQWDLAWNEIVQVFTFRQQDFFLHMKPYRAFDLKQVLRAEYDLKTAPEGDYSKILEEQSVRASKDFFNKHFIKFSGLKVGDKEWTPEEILTWIKAKSFGLEETIIKNMLGSVEPDPDEREEDVFDLSSTEIVRTRAKIFHPETKERIQILMAHHVAVEERHYRRFKQSHSTRIDRRKGIWERPVNHDVREEIYNQTIQSVDGMTLGGKPCSLETKQDWIDLVPYWHKLIVTNKLFQEVEAKN